MKHFRNLPDWERMIVQELTREHEQICRTHKIKLKTIGLELFDSETLWGQYNHHTKTILISKKLVDEYSWHFVVGVLHHEMAHQYLAEHHPDQYENEHSHGQAFKDACQRIGVPSPFARAKLNLKSQPINWQTEPRNEAVEKIIDKTKKLLSLAHSTNEHEAHLAMTRVREMYAKYNLEHIDSSSQADHSHLVMTNKKKKLQAWEQRAVNILTEHFFVKALRFQQYDAQTGERNQAIELIGRRENLLMAEFVYQFLLQQLEYLLNQQTPKLMRSSRTSFRLGVLDGFDEKLKLSSKTQDSTVTHALVKFHNDPALEQYMSKIYPRLRNGRGWSHSVDDGAFSTGQTAGRKLNLKKPLTSNAGFLGRLLNTF